MAWRLPANRASDRGEPTSILAAASKVSFGRSTFPSIATASTSVRTPSLTWTSTSTHPPTASSVTRRTSTVASRNPSSRYCSATNCVPTRQASAWKTTSGSEVRYGTGSRVARPLRQASESRSARPWSISTLGASANPSDSRLRSHSSSWWVAPAKRTSRSRNIRSGSTWNQTVTSLPSATSSVQTRAWAKPKAARNACSRSAAPSMVVASRGTSPSYPSLPRSWAAPKGVSPVKRKVKCGPASTEKSTRARCPSTVTRGEPTRARYHPPLRSASRTARRSVSRASSSRIPPGRVWMPRPQHLLGKARARDRWSRRTPGWARRPRPRR